RGDEAAAALLPLLDLDIRSLAGGDPLGGAHLAALATTAPLLPPDLVDALVLALGELRGQLLISGASVTWSTELALGMTLSARGRLDEAAAMFAAAVAHAEDLGLPVIAVWARWQWSRMLVEEGGPSSLEQARELAATAAATARAFEMPV